MPTAHLSFETPNGTLKAAGEATRLRVLALLGEAELTVSDLTAILRQSQPRISRHLRLLAEAGLVERFRELPQLRPITSPLTAREWEIVDLLGPERTTVEIADTLVISHETVRSHVKSIMRKLGVHSRHEAPEAAERLRLAAA